MQPSAVSQFVLAVPERVARVQSGMLFALTEAGAGEHGARFAQVAQFLQWLTPLNPISKEVQRILGLCTPHARQSGQIEEGQVNGDSEPIADVEELQARAEDDEVEVGELEQERILQRLAVSLDRDLL